MARIPWYLLLSLVALLFPVIALGQTLREAAPFPGGPRVVARAVLIPKRQEILLYAGASADPDLRATEDLWSYDLVSGRWESVSKSDPWPGPRLAHCMAADASGDGFYLYGGDVPGKEPDYTCADGPWRFDASLQQWKHVASGLPGAPSGVFSGMSVDTGSGDPWVFFGACGTNTCNWYFAHFDQEQLRWRGAAAPRDLPGGSTSAAAPFDPQRGVILLRGGAPPRGCFDSPNLVPELSTTLLESAALSPHSLWAFDPRNGAWQGLGAIAGSPARQAWPLSDYDPVSGIFLQYGGRDGLGGVASDSLWAFDVASQTWDLLLAGPERSRARYDAAGAYCPCTGEMFVTTGAESTAFGGAPIGACSDAYFLRIEQPADFAWDGAAPGQRNAPWHWGSVTLDDDGEIQPGSVRMMNCATAKDLQVAEEIKRIGRGRWHVRFRAPGAEEEQALASGHLVLTGRVQGRPVNFLAKLKTAGSAAVRNPEMNSLRCEEVAGGWRIHYAGDHPEKARLQVFDVAGKLLARFDAPFGSGNSFVWDGRDGAGRRLANGIYFLRATGSGTTAKAVLVR